MKSYLRLLKLCLAGVLPLTGKAAVENAMLGEVASMQSAPKHYVPHMPIKAQDIPAGSGGYSQYAEATGNPDLVNLANSLGNDRTRIFEWVYNNITTEYYFGCERGAYMTYLDLAGDDADQCALLSTLFKIAGANTNQTVTVNYYEGTVSLPLSDTASGEIGVYQWLGTTDLSSAVSFLNYQLASSSGNAMTFQQMWLKVTWPDGVSAYFAPAIKPVAKAAAPDPVAASGYQYAMLHADASGRVPAAGQVWVNSPQIKSYLTSLVTLASPQYHLNMAADVAGLPVSRTTNVLAPIANGAIYPSNLTLTSDVAELGTNMPLSYTASMTLFCGNWVSGNHNNPTAGSLTETFETPFLAGQPIQFFLAAQNHAATIIVGNPSVSWHDSSGGAGTNITVTFFPPSAFVPSEPTSQGSVVASSYTSDTVNPPRDGQTAYFNYAFGSSVHRMKRFAAAGGQTISQQYLSQIYEIGRAVGAATGAALQADAAIAHADCRYLMLYEGGFEFNTNGSAPIIDFGVDVSDFRVPSAAAGVSQAFNAYYLLAGGMEGTAVHQSTLAPSYDAVHELDVALNSPNGSLQFTAPTSSQTGQLSPYPQGNDDTISSCIILPGNRGVASVIESAFGGLASNVYSVNRSAYSLQYSPYAQSNTTPAVPRAVSAEPVDLSNGAYLLQRDDLVIGGGEPKGLRLTRFYNSAMSQYNPAGIGNGWTHSYMISINQRSPFDLDDAIAVPDDLLPFVIASRAIENVLSNDSTGLGWATAAVTAAWATDVPYLNHLPVTMGDRTIDFIRMPDGTYHSPPNIDAALTAGQFYILTFAHGNGNTITFGGPNGNFSSITDPYCNSITATYTGGLLNTVSDCYNRTITFNYVSSYPGTVLASVSDTSGRTVSYKNIDSGSSTNLLAATDTENHTENYTYADTAGLATEQGTLLTQITNGIGTVVINAYSYNSLNQLTSQESQGIGTQKWTFGVAPGCCFETDPQGNVTRSYFDARGRRVAMIDPANRNTQWTYDSADRLTGFTLPSNNGHTYSYDNTTDYLTGETDSLQNSRIIHYDAMFRPDSIQDFKGQTTTVTWTPTNGNKVTQVHIIAPGSLTETVTFDSATGNCISDQRPSDYSAVQFSSFLNGLPQTITYPVNGSDLVAYDTLGNISQYQDRDGVSTSYWYNTRNQLKEVDRWGSVWSPTANGYIQASALDLYQYDAAGNLQQALVGGLGPTVAAGSTGQSTNSGGGTTTYYTFDSLGHLTLVQRGVAKTTVAQYAYDICDRLWQITDGMANVYTATYQPSTGQTTLQDPLLNSTIYGTDVDSNFDSLSTPLQNTTSFAYNGERSISTWFDPRTRAASGSSPAVTVSSGFTYDPNQRLEHWTNRLANLFKYCYDDANRTYTLSTPLGTTRQWTFDSMGRTLGFQIQKGTDPVGNQATISAWDKEGRPTAWSDNVASSASVSYTPAGRLWTRSETINGTTITTTRTYDTLGRLKVYNDGYGNNLQYAYYNDNQVRQVTYPNGSSTVTYTYDDNGRMHSVTDWASRSTYYTYDGNSRVKEVQHADNSISNLGYDNNGRPWAVQELAANGSRIFSEGVVYDADGRATTVFSDQAAVSFQMPSDSLAFDSDNRLQTWNGQAVTNDDDGNMTFGPSVAGGAMASYTFDARDRLTSQGSDSNYVYNPDNLRVALTDSSGTTTFASSPPEAGSSPMARTSNGTVTYYVYGLGLLYGDVPGVTGAMTTYHFDHRGNTVAQTGADGNAVTGRAAYSAYGTVTSSSGTLASDPFRFAGCYGVITDSNKLVFMRNRYYNPRIMRFVSADPTGFDGGANWYAYVDNDPLDSVDPDGLERGYAYLPNGSIVPAYDPRVATLRDAPPGFWEGSIPIWGPEQSGEYNLEHGNPVFAMGDFALAVSDAFLVRSFATGASRGFWKFGSNTWGATSKWLTKTGWREFRGQEMHHWLLQQASSFPNWLKNQPWNLIGTPSRVFHQALHGVGPRQMTALERVWYGTPSWFKALLPSLAGRGVQTVTPSSTGDKAQECKY